MLGVLALPTRLAKRQAGFTTHRDKGSSVSTLQTLTRYKSWADEQLLKVLAGLSAEQLTTPQPIVFGSLIRTLNHARCMDHVWRCHLLGQPHGLSTRNPVKCPDLSELAALMRELNAWFEQYAEQCAHALEQKIDFEFIGGGRGSMTRGEILLHVVNHSTYHRGHIADMLYRFKLAPPQTDLPVFLRQSIDA